MLRSFLTRLLVVKGCYRPVVYRSALTLLLVLTTVIFFHYVLHSDFYLVQMGTAKLAIQNVELSRLCRWDGRDLCGRKRCLSPTASSTPMPMTATTPFVVDHNRDKAFFLETSGSASLNVRQACAVESLARHDPDLSVRVFLTGTNMDDENVLTRTLQTYVNVRMDRIDLGVYLSGTPLEEWYFCTPWNYGPYAVSHLSDALRFLTLAKYGGYYLDLDVITVRPLTSYRNFAAVQDDTSLGIGAIHADLGHPLIEAAVDEFRATYRRDSWVHNGPALLTRLLRKRCLIHDLSAMSLSRCGGFQALPRDSFYSISPNEWQEYFMARDRNDDPTLRKWSEGQLDDRVLGAHVWNKLSADQPVRKNSTQLYSRLARDHCPLIYSIAPDTF